MIPFFKSKAVTLFPTGDSKISQSSEINFIFPELYRIPHKLENLD